MKLTIVAMLLILVSCVSDPSKPTLSYAVSLEARAQADSIGQTNNKKAPFDTTDLYKAPVKVISAELFNDRVSNYKSIKLVFKNVSDKRIESIRFQWYGENATGDLADVDSSTIIAGFGVGFEDDPLLPGKIRTCNWSILNNQGKKVILSWPCHVVFSDGSKWEMYN